MLILLAFIPAEMHWNISGVRIEPYRLFLLLACIYLAPRIIRHKYDKKEIFLLGYCALVFISLVYVHGLNGIQSGVINFLEVFIAYFIGLSISGDPLKLRKCTSLLMILFLLLAPFAIIEATNGYRIFHVIAGEITGAPYEETLGDNYFRHGIHRASTIFAHPILYSVIAVMYLPILFRLYTTRKAIIFSGGILVATVTSVTSAGFLMIFLIIGLYIIQKSSKSIPNIYKYIVSGSLVAYLAISIASNRGPIQILIQALSLNPETAYTRYLQWSFAADDISANPIFGIGFNEWTRPFWMPLSVDSYWLLGVLQNGYPALALLAAFFILSLRQYWIKFHSTQEWLFFCLFVSISAFVLAAFTVDYFDRAHLMLYLTMGFYNSFFTKRITSKATGDQNA